MIARTFAALLLGLALAAPAEAATLSGRAAKWQPLTIDFAGPDASERDDAPNPFLDYRLTVELTSPTGRRVRVPGFFAGDGRGGASGNVWRARFAADEVGTWRYEGSLRRGTDVAVELAPAAGEGVALPDARGSVNIAPTPTDASGFLALGRLEHVGAHYLKFRDGPYWIKGGTDSPENLLAFRGFDGTRDTGGPDGGDFLHDFDTHRQDFRDGDPLFTSADSGTDSRGLIGALNYLGREGVNSVYFLPMNLGGDGQDTWPFIGPERDAYTKTHYDLSKLHQWNLALEHAQRVGVALQIVLSETEPDNERWLDDGAFGIERRLFFRELVARFGHLLAVKWNLGEENDFPVEELRRQADYLRALDWSGKPIAVHTRIDDFRDYERIVGDRRFEATSIQYTPSRAGAIVEQWRARSRAAGHPWVVDMDENLDGLTAEAADQRRREILYDVYFSGGNIEWFYGSAPLPAGGDQNAGDFRQREIVWRQMRHARRFMEEELPFWRMQPADALLSGEEGLYGGGEVFAAPGEVYAVYLPASNGRERFDLRAASGTFTQRWFDPVAGEFVGGGTSHGGGQVIALDTPPARQGSDWVVLLRRDGVSLPTPAAPMPAAPVSPPPVTPPASDPPGGAGTDNTVPRFDALPTSALLAGRRATLRVTASDPDGTPPAMSVTRLPPGMRIGGASGGWIEFVWDVPAEASGEATIELVAYDARDRSLAVTERLVLPITRGDGTGGESGSDGDGSAGGANPVENAANSGGGTVTGNGGGTPNAAPRFDALPSAALVRGRTETLRVTARDPDGTPPAMSVTRLPPGMRVSAAGGGWLELVWRVPSDAADEATIELVAYDARDRAVAARETLRLPIR